MTVNRLEIMRAGLGLCQLISPELLASRVARDPLTRESRIVIRILGARHLLQALLLCRTDSHSLRRVGGVVDTLHALSMVGLGVADGKRRRLALVDASVAGSFALAEFRA